MRVDKSKKHSIERRKYDYKIRSFILTGKCEDMGIGAGNFYSDASIFPSEL